MPGDGKLPRESRRSLVEWDWEPEWVLSSDAVRTQETFAEMSTVLSGSPSVSFLPTLYHAGIAAVQRQIVDVPEEVQTVLLLGHNPGWEEVAWWLCGEELVLKTADAALMERQADDWSQAVRGQGTWKLWNLLRSREL